MELADGTPAAVGVRVVTVRGSGSSHCKIGHTSVICKINPDRDPVCGGIITERSGARIRK